MTDTADKRKPIAEAAQFLVDDDFAVKRYQQLMKTVEFVRKENIPLKLIGPCAPVDPLLSYATSQDDMAWLVEIINKHRVRQGKPPLVEAAPVDPTTEPANRREYLAEFMYIKRQRETRLIDLWNSMRSEHDKIKGRARVDWLRLHSNAWAAAKKDREEAAATAAGRRLRRDELRRVQDQFWDDVDAELDRLEAFTRDEIRKPLTHRNPSGFKFTVGKYE